MEWVFICSVNKALKNDDEENDSFSMYVETEKEVTDHLLTSPRGNVEKLISFEKSDQNIYDEELWDEPLIVHPDSEKMVTGHHVAPLKIKLDDSMSDLTPSLAHPVSHLSHRNRVRVPPLEFWKGTYLYAGDSPRVIKERVRRIRDRDEERIEEEFEEENIKERKSIESVKLDPSIGKEEQSEEEKEIQRMDEMKEPKIPNELSRLQTSKPQLSKKQPVSEPRRNNTVKESKPKGIVKPKELKRPTESHNPKESKSKPNPKSKSKSNFKSKPNTEVEEVTISQPVPVLNPWSEEELKYLQNAVETVPLPLASPLFWTQVSLRIHGRSAEECEAASRDHGFKPPEKQIPKKSKSVSKGEKGMKLARKGTMKRKRQLREIMGTLDQEEDSKEKETIFDAQQINREWEAAFKVKTPSISRKRGEPLNTSVMVRMNHENEI